MKLLSRMFLLLTAFYASSSLADEWTTGFTMIKVSDEVVDYEVDVAIWYPTQIQAKKETIGSAILYVAKGAKPLPISNGLIIISHGFSGDYLGHNNIAQFLAKLGYVVATPTHPDLIGLKSGKSEFDPLVARPRHIQLIIDELWNHPSFKASVTQNRIGIIGFSLGTYTALMTIGAAPDFSGLASYCAENMKDNLLCSPRAKKRFSAIETNILPQRDSRIGGAVLLAPAYGPLFPEASLTSLETSVQLFSAENDQELDNRYNAKYFEEFLPNIESIETIKDAGHFVFMAPCPKELKRVVPYICKDADSVDRAMVHQKLNREIANFFKEALESLH